MNKISQREARRLRARVTELERELDKQRMNWSSDWPGGVHIATAENEKANAEKIQVARKLGHAVVATDNGERIEFRALPLPAKK